MLSQVGYFKVNRETGFISLFPPPSVIGPQCCHLLTVFAWPPPWKEVSPWGGLKVSPLINQGLQQDGTYKGKLAGDSFIRSFLCAKEVTPKCDLVWTRLEEQNSRQAPGRSQGARDAVWCSTFSALGMRSSFFMPMSRSFIWLWFSGSGLSPTCLYAHLSV